MHRGLRPLGAGQGPLGDGNDGGVGDGTGKVSTQGRGRGGGAEGSKAAAQAVEGFIRKNIEAYFGCWTSTYTLFSLNPRLVRIFLVFGCGCGFLVGNIYVFRPWVRWCLVS